MNSLLKVSKDSDSFRQIFRYALIGVLNNLAVYIVYLMITSLGSTPKLTMSLLYTIGAVFGFLGNKHFTFYHKGNMFSALSRFFISHCIGYLLNLVILILFVDNLGFSHQLVQGVAVFVVSAFLFLTFKVFVFPLRDNCEQ